MKFARWVFRLAGIVGLVLLVPMYFLETQIGIDTPPPVTHPEFLYGFVGIGIAWQIAFLLISLDPARYRLMMIPSILEKFAFSGAIFILFWQGRVPNMLLGFALLDFTWALLFCWAYIITAEREDIAG